MEQVYEKRVYVSDSDSDDWGSQAEEDNDIEDSDMEQWTRPVVDIPDRVPLADKDGNVPSVYVANENEKPLPVQQLRATPEEMKEAIVSGTKDIVDRVAGEVVEQTVKKAMKSNQSGATFAQKKQVEKEVEKMVKADDDKNMREIGRLCSLMRRYSETYKKRFPGYRWRREYDPAKMSLSVIKEDVREFENILNSQHVPSILCKIIVTVMGGLGDLANLTPYGTLTENLKEDTETLLQSGECDQEIEQLSIELAEYFTAGPKKRLAFKLGSLVQTNISQTLKKKAYTGHSSSIDPRAASDL